MSSNEVFEVYAINNAFGKGIAKATVNNLRWDGTVNLLSAEYDDGTVEDLSEDYNACIYKRNYFMTREEAIIACEVARSNRIARIKKNISKKVLEGHQEIDFLQGLSFS